MLFGWVLVPQDGVQLRRLKVMVLVPQDAQLEVTLGAVRLAPRLGRVLALGLGLTLF